jgi:hypothetical protein
MYTLFLFDFYFFNMKKINELKSKEILILIYGDTFPKLHVVVGVQYSGRN